MIPLYEYAKYAQIHLPKHNAEEILVLARRLNFIVTQYIDDEGKEEIMDNLSDVNSYEKVIEQIKNINGLI